MLAMHPGSLVPASEAWPTIPYRLWLVKMESYFLDVSIGKLSKFIFLLHGS